MSRDRRIKVVLAAEVSQYMRDLDKAAASTRRFGDEAQKQSKKSRKQGEDADEAASAFTKYADEIEKTGAALTGFGAAGVAAMALSTKAAMDWESSWTGVLKTVDGTGAQLQTLEKELRTLAKTELPAPHEEIAAVAESAGQLGIATNNVTSFTRTMIDLGESTNLSSEQAATGLARFSNIMGTSQTDVRRLGSTIVGLGNNFATTESEILDLSMRLAGAGKQAGLSEGDVMGIAAAMSSVGIEAEAGGTAMSMTMKRIGSEVETNGEKLGLFAQVAGMSAEDFKTAWGQDAAGALNLFVAGLANTEAMGMSTNAVLAELGITGIRESDSLLRLSSAQGLVTEAMLMGNKAYEENIALSKEALTRYETSASKVAIAKNAINDAAIEIGSYLLPALAAGAESTADLANWMGSLPGPVKVAVTVMGGLASATALASGGFMLFGPRIAESIAATKRLAAAQPVLTRRMRIAGKAASAAAIGIAAFATALSYDGGETTQGLEEIEAGLRSLAGEATTADTVFKNIGSGNWFTGQKEEFSDLLDILTDDSGWAKADRGIADFLTGLNEAVTFGAYDARAEWQRQRDELTAYGQGLASLAGTDLPAATTAFRALVDEAGGTPEAAGKLIQAMPELRDALIGVATDSGYATDEATILRIAMGELQPPTKDASVAAKTYAESLEDQAQAAQDAWDALNQLADSLLQVRGDARGFEAAMDDANAALKDNGRTLDISTEKGRANQAALDDIAQSGLSWVNSLVEQGASQEEVTKAMESTRKGFIDTATQMGMTKKDARALADQLNLFPSKVETLFEASTAQAKAVIDRFISEQSRRQIRINVVANAGGGGPTKVQMKASGGAVSGPGTGTSDSIPALLSNGEHVLTAQEVQAAGGHDSIYRWRALMRSGMIPAFAVGGRVSWAQDQEQDSKKLIERRKRQVARERKDVKKAEKSVSRAEKALTSAQRANSDTSSKDKSAKAAAKRRLRAAQDAVKREKRDLKREQAQLKAAEDALKMARDSREDAASRTGRLREDDRNLTTEVRRGEIQDQATSGLSGGYQLVDRLMDQSRNGDYSKGQRNNLAKVAREAEVQFKRLYTESDRIADRLEKAQSTLADMASIKASVGSVMAGGFDLGDTLESGSPVYKVDAQGRFSYQESSSKAGSFTAAASSYKSKLDRIKKAFTTLASWGLPSSVMAEIMQKGPDAALEIGEQLVSSGRGEVQKLTGIYKQIGTVADQLGTIATRNYLTADGQVIAGGITAQEANVKAVEKAQAANEKALEKLGTRIENALLKASGYEWKNGKLVPIKRFAGGWVQGSGGRTSDSNLLAASRDEFVVRAEQAKRFPRTVEAINAGTYQPVAPQYIINQQVAPQVKVNVSVADDIRKSLHGMPLRLRVGEKEINGVIDARITGAVAGMGRGYGQ